MPGSPGFEAKGSGRGDSMYGSMFSVDGLELSSVLAFENSATTTSRRLRFRVYGFALEF